ncbi:MAG: HK97 gp10 family phage protein [Clostridia bacterium]|nr:HK97 gp10 family phage protein [Clostridia bacterium]
MPLEIRGLDDLSNDLSAMAAALSDDGPAINKALKAGAVPIEEQMKMNASSDPKIVTGDLYSSIRTHGVKHKKGGSGKHITIGVKHSEKGAFYSEPVEFGHGGPAPAPPHPFVRPAFDVRYPDACEEMKRVLRDALKP